MSFFWIIMFWALALSVPYLRSNTQIEDCLTKKETMLHGGLLDRDTKIKCEVIR